MNIFKKKSLCAALAGIGALGAVGAAQAVNLSVTYDYKSFKGITTPLTEKWIITQGQAWFVEQG